MTYFAISGLINGLVSAVCGAVVYFQDRTSSKNRTYALFCLTLSVWGFFYFLWQSASEADSALFYARALMAGAIFMPTLHYHQILTLFRPGNSKRRWLWVFYALALLFLTSLFTPYFIVEVEPKMFFRFWPVPGPLFHLYLASFLFQIALSVRFIWSRWSQSPWAVRNEILLVAIATTIGCLSGCTNFLLWYDIPVPPYPNVALSISVIVAALLFFRLGLFDVQRILKHLSIVLLIQGSLLAIVLPAAVPFANYLLDNPSSSVTSTFILFGALVGAVLSVGPFIYAQLVRNRIWLRGHLTDGLTHELKSPLGILQNALDQIEAHLKGGKPLNNALEYLNMAQKNAERLERQVSDLLQVAKLHDREITLEESSFSFNELIQDMVERNRPSALTKGINIDFCPNGTDTIRADRAKIGLVISNLLSNAIKFSTKGKVTLSTETRDHELVFSIADEGCGISTSELPRVFDSFFQGKRSTKGSGIGLTVARGFIQAHRGRIWVESAGLDLGTKVTFALPLTDGENE